MEFCSRCDRWFPHSRAHYQHETSSSAHNICWDCDGIDFTTWTGLKEHWVQSPRHDYCQGCNEHFDDEEELLEHYDDAHYYCRKCSRFFKDEHGLHEHQRQSDAHHYCVECKRLFLSASNLREHLNSSTHRPKDVLCQGCGLTFISGPALARHLESGACRSGVDRHTVNHVVKSYDTNNIITNPARIITNGNTSPGVSYAATHAAWNGDAFECYLCHKEYRSIKALNQHLSSPAHEDNMYICPLPACRAGFTTLSGLWSHIESEKCGVSKFRAVRNALDGIVGRMGRLTM